MGAFQQFHQYWTSKEAHSCKQQTNKQKEGENKAGTSLVRKFNNNYGLKCSHVQASQIICISAEDTSLYVKGKREVELT